MQGRCGSAPTSQMATLDQRRDEPRSRRDRRRHADRRARRHGDLGGQTEHVIGYMKDFLFSPEQARTPVGVLSGGERNRLMLARALAQPSNLLVLDEPTNDLDLETLDLLQEMLGDYPGTVILVSHDRDFLDRVVGSRARLRGRGALGRICRRLQRHGGPARAGVEAASGREGPRVQTGEGPRASRRRPRRQAQARLQRAARLKRCLGASPSWKPDRQGAGILADPDLYARDPARFQKAAMRLQACRRTWRGRGPLAGAGDAARRTGRLALLPVRVPVRATRSRRSIEDHAGRRCRRQRRPPASTTLPSATACRRPKCTTRPSRLTVRILSVTARR